MKKLCMISLLLFVFGMIVSGCNNSQEASNIYKNTAHNFSITIPDEWKNKYTIEETESQVHFIDVNNKQHGGVLFTITVWTKDKWSTDGPELMENIHIEEIASNENLVYTLNTPTDVQYDTNNEEKKNEYDLMFKQIESIKASFKLE